MNNSLFILFAVCAVILLVQFGADVSALADFGARGG